jgi:type I restriction enzyme M protein
MKNRLVKIKMAKTNEQIEKRLWDAANDLRVNSQLSANEYSTPILGLIFLKHADYIFNKAKSEIKRENPSPMHFQEKGVLYLPEDARYFALLNLSEGDNIGEKINKAMELIETENPNSGLKDILPKNYTIFKNDLLANLLKTFDFEIPEGDIFGRIYEYFLGKFAMAEGQGGGQFYTPTSLVKLIVEVIEPFHGKILDPACGSGGMFVQSANFVKKNHKSANDELACDGQEKTGKTINLAKMNLAVNGIEGDVIQGNTFYEDNHNSVGKYDFVMANPPFNVDMRKVDPEKVKGDPRWPLGVPTSGKANYLWIQAFWSALNKKGRAGFVMANSASDARGTDTEIRKELIKKDAVDVMIAVSSNFFYTVTLPCTLWFIDKNKKNTDRKGKVLFIDARNIFKQVDRAHREFTEDQI